MPAEEAYVLSPTDVRNIKSYVQHKYAAMPQEKRAEIVADAVKRIIHKQLPNFEGSIKRTVTEMLIRTVVLERQGPVRADDIFQACLALDRTDSSIFEPIHDWLENLLYISCQKPLMKRLMDELSETLGQSDSATKTAENGILGLLKGKLIAEGVALGSTAPAAVQAEIIALPQPKWRNLFSRETSLRFYLYSMLCLFLIAASLLYGWSLSKPSPYKLQPPAAMLPAEPPVVSLNGLPSELRYHDIDKKRLKQFLESKSSVLAEPPYFDTIVSAAHTFDIHPVILFAITGQEQGFVPKTNKQHKQIANNPFNVFHSWQEFNTDIKQSAEIAARTVSNLSKDRPAETDPFKWINRKYAEDPKWSDGVRSIFASIMKYLENPPVQ